MFSKQVEYYACEFDDGKTGVVPTHWTWKDSSEQSVSFGEYLCRWVNSRRHVKEGAPPNPKWKVYGITKFLSKKLRKYMNILSWIRNHMQYVTLISFKHISVSNCPDFDSLEFLTN